MKGLKLQAWDILRWSERYFKTDMVYLAKGGFWITFGQAATSIISLFLTIFFANFLPKETYGIYRYLLSIAAILNIFSLTGMNQAVAQAVATGNEGALRVSVKYQLKWGLIMLFAFWVLGAYYFLNGNLIFAAVFFIMGVSSPLVTAFNTYGAYLQGKREFGLNNIFSVISVSIYAVSMVIAIMLSGELIWLIIAYSLATLVANWIFYYTTIRIFKPPLAPADSVLKYGREMTAIGFIGPIASQIDSIILSHFWGPAQLAVYTLAMAIPNRAISFIKNLLDIVFPKLATKKTGEINQIFYIRISQGVVIGIIFALAYVIIAPYIFKYLLPKYLDSVFYSQLLAISFVFAMPNRYINLLFIAQKLSRLMFINNLVQSIIRILLYIILGVWGGILGLVVAQLLNSLLSLIINIIVWQLKKPA
ncbi:MAG: oligosaccharide flippase family protein [Candidatus Paceibacterota bacterium]|jgi:O-antigen/teichoic acid export membrane protein